MQMHTQFHMQYSLYLDSSFQTCSHFKPILASVETVVSFCLKTCFGEFIRCVFFGFRRCQSIWSTFRVIWLLRFLVKGWLSIWGEFVHHEPHCVSMQSLKQWGDKSFAFHLETIIQMNSTKRAMSHPNDVNIFRQETILARSGVGNGV